MLYGDTYELLLFYFLLFTFVVQQRCHYTGYVLYVSPSRHAVVDDVRLR